MSSSVTSFVETCLNLKFATSEGQTPARPPNQWPGAAVLAREVVCLLGPEKNDRTYQEGSSVKRRIGAQKKEPASGHSPLANHFGQLTLSVGSLRPAIDIS